MQRQWWWTGGVAALLMAAAQAQSAAVDPQPMEEELGADAGPRFELALGRSTIQRGFALDIAGGTPHGWALLSLQRAGAPVERRLVGLDESGAARILQRNHELDEALTVTCAIPGASGTASRTLLVPASSQIPLTPNHVLATGDLVISEIMKDPTTVTDSAGEWIELRNLTASPINLEGWKLTDAGSNSHTIHGTNGVWVPARSYYLLGINADPATNGGIAIDYKYSSFSLGNGADDVRLSDPTGLLVDAVAYDDGIFWPDSAGKSISLERALVDAALNDDGNNWCDALNAISITNADTGTPRRANNVCP